MAQYSAEAHEPQLRKGGPRVSNYSDVKVIRTESTKRRGRGLKKRGRPAGGGDVRCDGEIRLRRRGAGMKVREEGRGVGRKWVWRHQRQPPRSCVSVFCPVKIHLWTGKMINGSFFHSVCVYLGGEGASFISHV